jgi:hypothetical protein
MTDEKQQHSLPRKSIKLQEKRKKLRDKQKTLERDFLCDLGRLVQQVRNSLESDVMERVKAIYEKHEVVFDEKD